MKKIIILIVSSLIIFTSCQDVIDIELNKTEPKLVVEGEINNIDEGCSIKLSKTGDYFSPTGYTLVSKAVISISGNNETVSFSEIEAGVYKINDFLGVENTSYQLKIIYEDKEYTADVTIPNKVNIDSISVMPTPPSPMLDSGLIMNLHFEDPAEYTNYYRIKAYKISDSNKGKGTFVLYDDLIMNGNSAALPYMFESFQLFDTVVVELLNLDKSTYDFYNTLSDIVKSTLNKRLQKYHDDTDMNLILRNSGLIERK